MPNDPLIEEYWERFKRSDVWSELLLSGNLVVKPSKLADFLRTSLKEYGDKRVGEIKELVLDTIQNTDWIEEPKSAFGKLNQILQFITQKQ